VAGAVAAQQALAVVQLHSLVHSAERNGKPDRADAAYLRQAGNEALLSGDIGAGGNVLSGIAGAFRGLPGAGPASSNPTQIGSLY